MVIIGPASLWYLRQIEDTYKIKRELFASILVLFPLYVLHFIWDRFFRNLAPGLSVFTPPVLVISSIFSGWIPLADAVREDRSSRLNEGDRKWSGSESSQTGSRSSRLMGNTSESTRPSLTRTRSSVATKPETPDSHNETPLTSMHGVKETMQKGKTQGSTKLIRQPLQHVEVSGRAGFYQTLTDPERYQ
ncbi:hypothetical protein BJ742DRAFT_131 [Cladochytrium replicatum]|nr:hypothetical protein BJ742DRAFT_131 [Cladochytrium replicatum]